MQNIHCFAFFIQLFCFVEKCITKIEFFDLIIIENI